ncbi:MAG: glycosyltransferase family 39 protein [Pseudomonadota bacterium]
MTETTERRGGVVLFVLLCVAVALSFLPGQAGVPPIDRDEPRYTQATKQMLETGDFIRIRFQDGPRHKKPVGIHWLQAGAVTLVDGTPGAPLWVYRLPSLFGAMVALLGAIFAARAFLSWRLALTVGALFGATIILGVEARLAKTDAVLCATIFFAQGALARLWLAERRNPSMALLFWAALGLGILVKGPIAPMVCGLTLAALALWRWRGLHRRLMPLIGVPLAAAICLPWYIAIYVVTDGAFFAAAVGVDFLGKATTGQEGHGAPPLTHIGFFAGVAWPLAGFVIAAAWRVWRRRADDAIVFALAWALPAWIVFELTPTKLPHYTLPMIPALAMAACWTLAHETVPKALRILAAIHIALAPVVILIAAPFVLGALADIGPQSAALIAEAPVGPAAALLAFAAVFTLSAGLLILRGWPFLSRAVVGMTVVGAVVAQTAVWGIALPALGPVWVSPRLVEAVGSVSPCPAPRLASVGGFNEPSMIFLAGTDTALATPEAAVAIAASQCTVIAVRARAVAAVEAAAAEAGLSLRKAGTVDGFNISKGDPIVLTLYVRAEG